MKSGRAAGVVALALCAALAGGCTSADRGESATLFAMDTVMELTAYGEHAQEALEIATQEIERLERLLSAYRPESDIARANAAQGAPVTVSDETAQLLARTLECCAETAGAMDVTICPVMEAWGFPSGEYRVPGQEELDALLAYVDHTAVRLEGNTLTVPAGAALDLGAVGKGYTADRIDTLWRELGVTSGLFSLGGNVQCLGGRPDGTDWTVGIRDPEDANAILATVTGRDMAVVTSGAYQRNFTQDGVLYHHIMDPATARPADHGATSVSVIGESGFVCDALSTALFVMGPERAADFWRTHGGFEMVYCAQDGSIWYTSGLQGRLTLRDGLEGQMLT